MCVDDFSRFCWVEFLRDKSETFQVFKALCFRLQKEKARDIGKVIRIRSDHGREFENNVFAEFCEDNGISHEFSAPITPQQNGIVERKNRSLQEMARVMLHTTNIPLKFWAEAFNTACYILNCVSLHAGTSTTCYEIWKGRKLNIKYFRVFGSPCYVLNDREQRSKLDAKSDEGVFLGYSTTSRAFRVYNKRTRSIMESINVVINDDITP